MRLDLLDPVLDPVSSTLAPSVFDKKSSWQRYAPDKKEVLRVHLGHVPALDEHADEDRKRMAWGVALAIVVHLILIVSQVNWWNRPRPAWSGSERSVFVLQPVRFQPPPAESAPRRVVQKPKEKRRLIPVPDPTPHEPEPIEDLDVPELDVDELLVTIPDAPSGRGTGRGRGRGTSAGVSGGGEGPVYVGGNVSPPRKIYAPQPIYTEEARLNRIQGVVILQAVIDAAGNVQSIDVVRGLPHGLTDAAVDTVETWRFEPARQEGRPVPVYYTLTIGFTVQ